ncbi:hypothetical protein [Zooshikella harenae]|uniref:Uncharacterized protein n=1 Tax=Zooshikella harenae TaxID=2827238 RepID=A0ABS5ZGI2_9GAMM|nr:hypothetical protein [Zooshikella harenae]MBU2713168.1 hypothetical protein [Zooshikella harenae]
MMRDPQRIKQVLELINQIWMNSPDLRFNQLIYNLQYDYSHQNGGVGKIQETERDGFVRVGFDLFNVEDDEFIKYLKSVRGGRRC